jgi:predicted kinase
MKGVVVLLGLLLAGAATWAGANPLPEDQIQLAQRAPLTPGAPITLTRIDPSRDNIEIDGFLDEPVWQTLPTYDEFVVIEPDTLGDTSHETLVRLAYDDRGLYVGVDMRQPPETLIKRLSGRDQRQINRDSINLTLDTSGEGRYGFWFGVNLGDSLMDGTVLPERHFSNEWDGPWRGRSQATDTGWSAELFIPWSTMSMPSTGEIRRMGFYMSRKVAYLDERWGWPALPDTVPKFMSALQTLEMSGVAPRQQYNFYPFVGVTDDRVDGEMRYRVGADLFWRPSSNFQLNATLNPDFGNVESDEVVINLTATETFFPEKRLFFLEGQEIFFASPRADTRNSGVGNSGTPYTMVNTRRIGGKPTLPPLAPGVTVPKREVNQFTDLLGAVQASGQVGGFRYGVLGAFEDDVKLDAFAGGLPLNLQARGNDYGIARLLYEDNATGAYRAVGLLSTAVLNPQRDAIAHGVDWHYLAANGKIKVDGQAMTSAIDGIDRGYGGFVDLEYTIRRGMAQRFGFEYFDETFNINDLGFLQRNNHYRLRSSFIHTRANLGRIRNNQFDLRGFVQKNVSESLPTGLGIFLTNRATFHDFSAVTARLNFTPKQYDDLNSFGNGTFRIEERTEAFLQWDSDTTRSVGLKAAGGYRQENLGGNSWIGEGGVTWRPNDQLNLALAIRYEDRQGWLLHQGRDLMATFDAEQWQPSLSADYFISARQQFRVSLQWVGIKAREDDFYRIPTRPDDLIPIGKPTGAGSRPSYDFSVSQYSFQARYRWEIAPLSDIFLVYTRQADRAAALGEDGFQDLFSTAWREPLQDYFVFKIRYRLGS